MPSANTRAAYRGDLNVFARWCAEHDLTPISARSADLEAFERSRQELGDSPATLRRRWSSLSSFFRFALQQRAIRSDPVSTASRAVDPTARPTAIGVVSASAIERHRARAAEIDHRLAAIIALLVLDGLKLGEVLALDVESIRGRPPRSSVLVPRRTGIHRVELHRETSAALRRSIGRRTSGPMFLSAQRTTSDASRLTRFGADHLFRQLETADHARITANELRRFHFAASSASGEHPNDIRARTGLVDPRSLTRYATED
jgi:integrase/recombinase XerD